MRGPSMNTDAISRYYNELWLDQLIEEAFRLAKEKKELKKEKGE